MLTRLNAMSVAYYSIEFRLSLRLVESAPELVFERLVGNVLAPAQDPPE